MIRREIAARDAVQFCNVETFLRFFSKEQSNTLLA